MTLLTVWLPGGPEQPNKTGPLPGAVSVPVDAEPLTPWAESTLEPKVTVHSVAPANPSQGTIMLSFTGASVEATLSVEPAITVTVADALVVPPGPVQVRVKVCAPGMGKENLALPAVSTEPDQAPEAVQELVPMVVHPSRTGQPITVGFAEAEKFATGGADANGGEAAAKASCCAPATATLPAIMFVAVSMMAMDCALLFETYSCPGGLSAAGANQPWQGMTNQGQPLRERSGEHRNAQRGRPAPLVEYSRRFDRRHQAKDLLPTCEEVRAVIAEQQAVSPTDRRSSNPQRIGHREAIGSAVCLGAITQSNGIGAV